MLIRDAQTLAGGTDVAAACAAARAAGDRKLTLTVPPRHCHRRWCVVGLDAEHSAVRANVVGVILTGRRAGHYVVDVPVVDVERIQP